MVTEQKAIEFQELVKDAPNFASMERGELVTYAYAMYAAGAKTDAENAKLLELVRTLHYCTSSGECDGCPVNSDGTAHLMPDDICDTMLDRMHELGVVE